MTELAQKLSGGSNWKFFLLLIGLAYPTIMLFSYIAGAIHGIDNTYERTTEILDELHIQKERDAQLQREIDELKQYLYGRFG